MTPKRILVVMPNWFGETLFTTPFLRRLHQGFPQAHIAGLGVPRCEEILSQNPHLHEFITYDERSSHQGLAAKGRLITTLRLRHLDTAFILRRSLSRTALLLFARISRRVGFANLKSGWLLTDRVRQPPGPIHKAYAYLSLLEPFGVVDSGPQGICEYYPSPIEREWALSWLREEGLGNSKPIVVLHPGANWHHKRWRPERFAELGNRLAVQHRVELVITGGPEDQPIVEAILERLASRPRVLAGKTTLRQLAACLEQASLVIANDTGLLHVACALGRPAIGLYGPTSPAITGPLGDPQRTVVLHHPDCCPAIPCYHPDHPGYPGMDAITVDEVFAAACKMLEGERCQVTGERTRI